MAQLAKVIRTTDGYNFFVDVEDFARLSKFKWHSYFDGFHRYASRYVGKKAGKDVYKSLHREVLNVNSKYEVDHISGDTSDNRKENLRLCTHQENMRNQGPRKGTSKYKGVSWNSAKQKSLPNSKVTNLSFTLKVLTSSTFIPMPGSKPIRNGTRTELSFAIGSPVLVWTTVADKLLGNTNPPEPRTTSSAKSIIGTSGKLPRKLSSSKSRIPERLSIFPS